MPSLRPDDRDALRAALRAAHSCSALPVAFGGAVDGGSMRLTDLIGTRTGALRNLEVRLGAGLGGRAMVEGRPVAVEHYGTARTITHEYDRQVLGEGLWSVLAVPVQVGMTPRAVMYVASRRAVRLGDRVKDAVSRVAGRLARELAVRDEVDRRLAMAEAARTAARAEVGDVGRLEEVRAVHAELRVIARALPEPEYRDRLAMLGAGTRPAVRLSGREADVLAQVALGCTNAETARRLSLLPETVKSYLAGAMRKLDAHTRHEAVVRARALGLLP